MEEMDVEGKIKESDQTENKRTGREGENESWRGSDTRRERKRERGEREDDSTIRDFNSLHD